MKFAVSPELRAQLRIRPTFLRWYSVSLLTLGTVIVAASTLYQPTQATLGSWPLSTDWSKVTSGGAIIADEESRASCADPTQGATAAADLDLGSQADCSGPAPHYNPGNNGQPNATNNNTYTFGVYYQDSSNNSSGCTNISDDYTYFRVRVAGNPLQSNTAKGFNNNIWFVLINADQDGDTDFYLNLNGNGDRTTETLTLIYDDDGDNSPAGDTAVATYTNPLDNGYARAITTPDNATVGDTTEYFIEIQVPVTAYDTNLGAQVLCQGAATLGNVTTSATATDPFQKDFKLGLGTFSDVIAFSPPKYQVTKTASDLNGGSLSPGDQVEYTVTIENLGATMNNLVFTDVLPAGSTFVTNSYAASSGIQATFGGNTYNITNAADSPDASGCPSATNCRGDHTSGTITFRNDWLYADGAVAPRYDTITLKFRVTFASAGTYTNQSTTTTTELPNNRLSDDNTVDDGIDCGTANTYNCSDGITGNDDGTKVTVVSVPNLSTSTKTENDADNTVTPGQAVTYTVTVKNTGTQNATGVNIDDTIDTDTENLTGFTFTNCGGSFTNTSTSTVVDINNLAVVVGTDCVITYNVTVKTPRDEGTQITNDVTISAAAEGGSGATPASSTLTVNATPNLSTSTKADNDGDNVVNPGQVVTYTTTIKNTGDGTATGVNVDDTMDTDLENLSVSSLTNCGTFTDSSTANPAVLNIDGVDIGVGTDCVIVWTAQVKANALGGASVPNTVTIAAAMEGGSGASPSSDTLTVASIPNLSTSTKSDNDVDNSVTPGQTVTYTVTLVNTGNATATGVDIDDTIDTDTENLTGFTFTNCGGSFANSSTSSVVNIDDLQVAVGTNCVVTYNVTVKTPLNEGTQVTNDVTISAAAEGGSGATPSSDTLTVDATPNLSTSTKIDNDADNSVTTGQTISYSISIKNTGNGAATGVNVDDTMDTDLEDLSVVGLTNCGTFTDNSTANPAVLDIDGVDIAVGTDCVIVFTAKVKGTAVAGSTIPNTVTISAAAEGGSGASPSSDLLTVPGGPDLSTSTKNDNDADNTVTPGQVVTYTITLINSGSTDGTGVDIDDTIDSNTENLTNFSFTNCGGSYVNNSTSTVVDIDDLAVTTATNCVVTYDVSVKSPLDEGTVISNSVNISSATEGGFGATPSSPNLTVNATPNLSTSTKADNDVDNTVDPSQTVTYTVTVVNNGNGTATGVNVDDTMDTDLENLSVSSLTNCGTFTDNSTANPAVLDIDGIDISVGTNCVIVFTAAVKSGTMGGASIPNTVTIAAAAEGGSGASPSSDTLTVSSNPTLATSTKAENDADNFVTPGQSVTYTVTLINTGNATGTGISLDDTIDSNLENLGNFSFSNCGTNFTNSSANGTVEIDDLEVAVGTNCVVTYDVSVKSPSNEGTMIPNQVTISAPAEGGSGATPASSTLTVNATPNLSTSTKSDSDGDNTVIPGQLMTYTLALKNTGDGQATGVTVDDVIDANTENLTNFTFLNCGGSYVNSSTASVVEIDGLEVAVGTDCVITYDVTVKSPLDEGTVISNNVGIGGAVEGGSGATPSSDALTVDATPNLSTSTKAENDADDTVTPGQTVTYTVTLKNTGNGMADGVGLDDTIDANTENLTNFSFSNCGTPTNLSSSPVVDINDLEVAVGTDCVVTYDVTVKSPLDEGTTIDNQVTISPAVEGGLGATPSSSTLTVDVTPDLSTSTKADNDGDDFVDPDQTVTYALSIANTGNGTATGVSVDDTLDTDLENLSVLGFTDCGSGYTNSSTANPAVLDIDGLEVAVGTNCIITFSAEVKAGTTGGSQIPNTATIAAAAEGGSGATPSSDLLTVSSTPNLSSSTKTDNDPDNFVAPGQVVQYTVTIINTGNATGTGVTLDDTLDTDLENLVIQGINGCGAGYTDTSTANPAVVNIDDLQVAVGTNCVVVFEATVKTGTANGSLIPNTATVGAATEGGNGASPSSSTLTSTTTPQLSTSTKDDNDADNVVTPGQMVTYTLTLKNTGNGTGTGISVDDTIDTDTENLTNFSFTNCGGSYTNSSTSTIVDIDGLQVAVGTDCVITYDVTVKSPLDDGDEINNIVTVSPAAEGGSGATPSSPTLTVDSTPDLSTSTKAENDADNVVTPGQVITYTVTINNTGNGNATGVTLDDTIDSNTENLGSFSFTGCGGSFTNSSTTTVVDVDGLQVTVGVSCVVTYTVIVKSPLNDGTTIDNQVTIGAAAEGGGGATPSSSTLTVDSTPDISGSSKSDSDGDNSVVPGQLITYTVSIPNTGTGDASGITLDDMIDTNLTNLGNFTFTDCGGVYSNNSSGSTVDIDGLAVAATATCVVTYQANVVSPLTEGTMIPNSVTIGAPVEGGSGATPSSDTLVVNATPVLSTSSKADNDADNTVTPGQTVTYTVTIANTGDGDATGVSLDDTIDSDLSLLGGNFTFTDCGTNHTNSSTATTVAIDDLEIAVGTNCVVTYQVIVDSPSTEGALIPNSVTISAAAEGGTGATAGSETLTVDVTPDLSASTKTEDDADNAVNATQTVTYAVTLTNTGNGTATGVSLADTLDAEVDQLEISSVTGCGSSYTDNSTVSPAVVDLSGLRVLVSTDCIVIFTVEVQPGFTGEVIDNSAVVSAAAEGGSGGTPASDSLTIVNLPPEVVDDEVETNEDTAVRIEVLANDDDPDGDLDLSTLTVTVQPDHGTVSIDSATGKITYTPDKNFHGEDSFTYEICDADGVCGTAVVSLTVKDVNDPPIARNDDGRVTGGESVIIRCADNDSDVDGVLDYDSISILEQPAHGTLSINHSTGSVIYTADADYAGEDSFRYEICDDDGACDTARVDLLVDAAAGGEPELIIRKEADPPSGTIVVPKDLVPGEPGTIITYTLIVENNTPDNLTGVKIEDVIDTGMIFKSGTLVYEGESVTDAADADAGDFSGGKVTYFVGNLDAGERREASYKIEVDVYSEAIPDLVNDALFTSNETGSLRSENQTVHPVDPFEVAKTVQDLNGGIVEAGDRLRYTITVKNIGHTPTVEVNVDDPLPPQIEYVAGTIAGLGADDTDPRHLRWAIGVMQVGAVETLSFDAVVRAGTPKDTVIENAATVRAPGFEPKTSSIESARAVVDRPLGKTGSETGPLRSGGWLLIVLGTVLFLCCVTPLSETMVMRRVFGQAVPVRKPVQKPGRKPAAKRAGARKKSRPSS